MERIQRNNWTLQDFQHLSPSTRVNFCDYHCVCTTFNSPSGIGNTRSRLVSQINQNFIDQLNIFNCWITEILPDSTTSQQERVRLPKFIPLAQ